MVHRVGVSISDHVWNSYFSESIPNRSAYINQLIELGGESLISKPEENKARLLALVRENEILRQELALLKKQIGHLKQLLEAKKKDKPLTSAEKDRRFASDPRVRFHKAMIKQGVFESLTRGKGKNRLKFSR